MRSCTCVSIASGKKPTLCCIEVEQLLVKLIEVFSSMIGTLLQQRDQLRPSNFKPKQLRRAKILYVYWTLNLSLYTNVLKAMGYSANYLKNNILLQARAQRKKKVE